MAEPQPPASVIKLSKLSQVFVDNRVHSLGPWVISAYVDAVLLGVVLCQVVTFFQFKRRARKTRDAPRALSTWLVVIVTILSCLKTAQAIAIVWVQNVLDFANPDIARVFPLIAWYQVSAPLLTGITGLVVQGYYALRFYRLSRNAWLVIPIILTMGLGFAAACLQMNFIIHNSPIKVTYLLIHLISVFFTDFFITAGTVWALLMSKNVDLVAASSLVSRLLRLVFEAAIPPTVIALSDLIMSQTIGLKRLFWHLVLNYMLAKLYVISLMYTLNSINDYRASRILPPTDLVSSEPSRGQGRGVSFRPDVELRNVRHDSKAPSLGKGTYDAPLFATPIVSVSVTRHTDVDDI